MKETIIAGALVIIIGLVLNILFTTLIIWGVGSLIISIFNIAYNLTFLKSLGIATLIVALKFIFGRGKSNG